MGKTLDSKETHVREMSEKLLHYTKMYWTILNRFFNNIKIPSIRPLLVNGKVVSNFLENTEFFGKFFASRCFLVENSITLPSFPLRTDKVVDKVSFSEDGITQIIKKLNPNKSHGWGNISIRMIKICDKSVSYRLKLVFEALFQKGIFPDS